jgi:LacI family transcriptional regulator
MPTIRDVALAAGCSVATVSRVINGRGKYESNTEKRVQDAIKRLGYRVNITARRLKRGSTMSVAFMSTEYRLLNHPGLVCSSVQYLQSHGFNVEIILGASLVESAVLLDEGRFDGLLITDGDRDERIMKSLVDSGRRFVLLGGDTDRDDVNIVEIDYFTGSYQATKLLIRNGHSEILLLSDRKPGAVLQELKRGYLFALDEHGIGYREDLIVTSESGDFSAQARFGYEAVQQTLSSERFTAIFCTHDRIAYGAIRAAETFRLQVPKDLSVVGFGDEPSSEYVSPPLTSVVAPLVQMAELGAEILVTGITRADSVVKSVRLKPHLVERETVAKRLT